MPWIVYPKCKEVWETYIWFDSCLLIIQDKNVNVHSRRIWICKTYRQCHWNIMEGKHFSLKYYQNCCFTLLCILIKITKLFGYFIMCINGNNILIHFITWKTEPKSLVHFVKWKKWTKKFGSLLYMKKVNQNFWFTLLHDKSEPKFLVHFVTW